MCVCLRIHRCSMTHSKSFSYEIKEPLRRSPVLILKTKINELLMLICFCTRPDFICSPEPIWTQSCILLIRPHAKSSCNQQQVFCGVVYICIYKPHYSSYHATCYELLGALCSREVKERLRTSPRNSCKLLQKYCFTRM